jgi:hypothetical protein
VPPGTTAYVSDPWNIPVPVRGASFIPLKRSHARFNIQCDPGAVAAFAFTSRHVPASAILYSDLQTNGDENSSSHLGSGRSGFFGGKYVKGVGRTPLAANWNIRSDRYHGSGHLLPSAAAREYLISAAFQARGQGEAINGCDGILAAAAPAEQLVRLMVRSISRLARPSAAPCDTRLTALTTKASHFARPSNFIWSLNHFSSHPTYIASVLTRLFHYLHPTAHAVDPSTVTPRAICEALAAAVDRGVRNFRTYLGLGTYWGSFHNNFTLDGRFLDLELPLFLGRPFLGVLDLGRRRSSPFEAGRGGPIIGLEVLHYLRQMRHFILYLTARLQFIVQARFARGVAATFVGELLQELRRRFGRSSILFNSSAQEGLALTMLTETFDLSARQRALLKTLIQVKRRAMEGLPRGSHPPVRLNPVHVTVADTEPGVPVKLHTIEGLPDFASGLSPDAELFNEGLVRVERTTDPQQFLSQVLLTESRLRRLAASPAA